MRGFVFIVVFTFLGSWQTAAEVKRDPGFNYFVREKVKSTLLIQDATMVYSILFESSGNGPPGVYAVDLLGYSDSSCTTLSIAKTGVGNTHTTTPILGTTYQLSGTGVAQYFLTDFTGVQLSGVHSFVLRDSLNPGTISNCIVLSCTTTDCTYVSGTNGTALTINRAG
jgi:hypothetical protein